MDRTRLLYLIKRYGDNSASPAELQELSEFIASSPDDELFTDVMLEQMEFNPLINKNLTAFEGLADQVLTIQRPKRSYKWIWAAACTIFFIVGGIYYWRQGGNDPGAMADGLRKALPGAIVPGRNGAILTLGDGSAITLDSMGNGKLGEQGGTDVFIRQGGLAYAMAEKSSAGKGTTAASAIIYNTLSTPKGRQYHMQLPDGTQVWLNAGSSLHYPTVFSGSERLVDVSGEAYFEVARDASRPFRVRAGPGAEISVLGTHFNINAYSNEPAVTTTLLEGSVKFNDRLLRPGQQSKLEQGSGNLTLINDVETSQVVAWKNGRFDFNNMSLQQTMHQLERWYDIDVVYEKDIPDIKFYGKMTRHIPLSDLLIILEKSKVHFQMEGRKLIVKP